jgi:Cytidylyltransferase-like
LIKPATTIHLPAFPSSINPGLAVKQQHGLHTSVLRTFSTPLQKGPLSGILPIKVRRSLSSSIKMDAYNFPDFRLKKRMEDPSKTPLLLVACGSFSPITFLHLRMFVMAADYVKFSTDFEIVGGYLSPVSEAYKKAGLASAEHR